MEMAAAQFARLNPSITASMAPSPPLPNVFKYAGMAMLSMLNAMTAILTMEMAAPRPVKSKQDFHV